MARFLHRVRLENYKSIAHCDVELQDLTFLVGPNGAGKSNFLMALALLAIYQLIPNQEHLGEKFDFIVIRRGESRASLTAYTNHEQVSIHIEKDKTLQYKGNLSNMGNVAYMYYDFIPSHYKEPQKSNDTSISLLHHGEGVANIISFMQNHTPTVLETITKFLRAITPEIERVWVLQAGGYDILQFSCVGSETPFNASQMSDGTLHALGVLTAIFHAKSAGIALLGIEEPEAGLHPAAARVLREALIEASEEVQIIVTSHSPDLLDSPDIHPDSILAVVRENGETKIGPIDAASRKTLDEHLFTAGELLRLNQLEPERAAA